MTTQHIETIVIGGGQAGLAVGYYLAREHVPFVILDAHARIGDAWRKRWDSLRLFSPARFDALPGLPIPVPPYQFPTKDEMADYLESYAAEFELPVRTGRRVEQIARVDGHFVVTAGDERFEADNVVVAMSGWQQRRVPGFAAELAPEIVQLHSSEYYNPGQLRDGAVLIVGAGNSGAEIAMDVVRSSSHRTIVAGRSVGQVPFPINAVTLRTVFPVLFRVIFHRIARTGSPLGRRLQRAFRHGMPLIRTRENDLVKAGVERAPRVIGVHNGLPMLEDERVLDVANVIWCTGYNRAFPELEIEHDRGVATNVPGLYFVGLEFV